MCEVYNLRRPRVAGWLRDIGRALLPSTCALCGRGCAGVACAACLADHFPDRQLRCPRCANPLPEGGCAGQRCAGCIASPPAFDATIAATAYAAPLDQLVLQLKFAHRLALAPWFAACLADAAAAHPELPLPELLLPVPLGPRRLSERGFNQALEIARPLARRLSLPCHRALLLRPVDTTAQSSVAPSARAANLRGAFTLAPAGPTLLRGRHVGLVDDVMTSGHTLAELAATLKRFGVARVTNFVFARTPPKYC